MAQEIKLARKDDLDYLQQEVDRHKADKMQHTPYAIASGTNSYAVNTPDIETLVEGMSVKVNFTSANTGACTLNINGLGAKPIQKSNGNALSSGNIKAGQICHLVYTGTSFQLLGEGGEGTAQPEDVLKGKTFTNDNGTFTGSLELTANALAAQVLAGMTFYNTNPKQKLTGAMPNRGSPTQTLTTQGGQYNIPAGYYSGGWVKAQFANLIAANIKKGVNIGGVVGSLTTFGMAITGTITGKKGYGSGRKFKTTNGALNDYDYAELSRSFGFIPSMVMLICSNPSTLDRSLIAFYIKDISLNNKDSNANIVSLNYTVRGTTIESSSRMFLMTDDAYVSSNGFRIPLDLSAGKAIEYYVFL